VRKLSTQARDPAPHSQHSEIGYNYRMSNVLAAIGRGQLRVLDELQHKVKESAPTGALHLERVGILGETCSAAQAAARWTMGSPRFPFFCARARARRRPAARR